MVMVLPPLSDERKERLKYDPAYDSYEIKRYSHWRLYLNPDQRYLGRMYAWLFTRHVDLHPFHKLDQQEYTELIKLVVPRASRALRRLYGPDLVNCCWLGNEIYMHRGHGHMHLIPRYFNTTPVFQGMRYPDPNPQKNYAPYEPLKFSLAQRTELISSIRLNL